MSSRMHRVAPRVIACLTWLLKILKQTLVAIKKKLALSLSSIALGEENDLE